MALDITAMLCREYYPAASGASADTKNSPDQRHGHGQAAAGRTPAIRDARRVATPHALVPGKLIDKITRAQ
jgi:hypothetical protein